jgi:TPR repeat protein
MSMKLTTFTLMLAVISTQALAIEDCDVLGSLEADPHSVSAPVSFQEIQSDILIETCTNAIENKGDNLARFHLIRARGYLRSGSYQRAVSDITISHEMGYPAATFARATLYHFGEALPQDLTKAAELYQQAYDEGVKWAARGLSMLYEDASFKDYSLDTSKAWLKRFDGP